MRSSKSSFVRLSKERDVYHEAFFGGCSQLDKTLVQELESVPWFSLSVLSKKFHGQPNDCAKNPADPGKGGGHEDAQRGVEIERVERGQRGQRDSLELERVQRDSPASSPHRAQHRRDRGRSRSQDGAVWV